MKKLIAVAATAILAACGGAPEEAAPEEAPVEEVVAESAVVPGTYEVTWSDGNVSTMVVNDDGTFNSTAGEEASSGTVEEVEGKVCFDAEGDEEGAMCWTASEPAEDGSWTSTSDDGEVVTVRAVES